MCIIPLSMQDITWTYEFENNTIAFAYDQSLLIIHNKNNKFQLQPTLMNNQYHFNCSWIVKIYKCVTFFWLQLDCSSHAILMRCTTALHQNQSNQTIAISEALQCQPQWFHNIN